MKSFITLLAFVFTSVAFGQGIQWKTLEQATKEIKQNPKKPVLFSVYAQWCGFCKRMDKETYVDAKVAEYINKNYIAVKFDAETKEMVSFIGINYGYIPPAKANYLAYTLMGGRLSYPTSLILNQKGEVQKSIVGYRTTTEFLTDIKI